MSDDWGNSDDKGNGGAWGDAPEPAKKQSSSGDAGGSSWGNEPSNDKPEGGGWGEEPSSKNSGGGEWGGGPSNNKSGGSAWGDATKSSDWSDNGGTGGGGEGGEWGGGSSRHNNRSSGGGGGGEWGGGQSKHDDSHRGGDDGGEERPAPYRPEELNLDEEAKFQNEGVGENFHRYKEQKVTCLSLSTIKPIEKFSDVIESKLLLENVKNLKYSDLTPIQKWAMPAIMNGEDLIGCAQTGSGKTAAFLLPILQTILKADLDSHDPNEDCQHPYCLVISPTRELARQIYTHAEMLSKDSIVKCRVIYGQIATAHLKAKISQGCHVLVSTPGRLKDFVQRGWIGFKNIKYIVLDEGDRLVDDGFMADIRAFFSHETMPPKDARQTLFFSATFKQEVQNSAKEFLKDDFVFLTVGRVGAANEDIKQEFIQVSRKDKKRELKNILSSVSDEDKTIIFTQTKIGADMLAAFFTTLGLSSTSIHGDRHQSQREQAITSFKRGEKRFLISSPVGNRGLDLPKVSLVINYDLPDNIDEYVHRIGRTGRAGHTGRAISFYDAERDSEVLPDLLSILEEAKQEIPDWMKGGGQSASAGGADDWALSSSTSNVAGVEDDWGAAPATLNTDDKQPETASNSTDAASTEEKKPSADAWGGASSSGGWGDEPEPVRPQSSGGSGASHSAGGSGGWNESSSGGGGGWGNTSGGGGESNWGSGSGGGGGGSWNRDSGGGFRGGRGSRPPRGGGRSFGGRSFGDDRGPRNDNWNRSDSDGGPFRTRATRFNSAPGRSGFGRNDSWNGGSSNGHRNDKPDDGGWGSSGGWGDSNPKRPADHSAGNSPKRHDNAGSGSAANNSNTDGWTSGW